MPPGGTGLGPAPAPNGLIPVFSGGTASDDPPEAGAGGTGAGTPFRGVGMTGVVPNRLAGRTVVRYEAADGAAIGPRPAAAGAVLRRCVGAAPVKSTGAGATNESVGIRVCTGAPTGELPCGEDTAGTGAGEESTGPPSVRAGVTGSRTGAIGATIGRTTGATTSTTGLSGSVTVVTIGGDGVDDRPERLGDGADDGGDGVDDRPQRLGDGRDERGDRVDDRLQRLGDRRESGTTASTIGSSGSVTAGTSGATVSMTGSAAR